MEQTEPGQPGFPPLTAVRFRTVSDFICAVFLESLIKHSLSSAGSAVFIGKSLLPWPAGTELGSSAGYRGDGQPFPWLESLPLWDVVVWEERGCTGGKPAQGRCLWRWLQLPKHTDLSLLPLSPWSGHTWRGHVEAELLLTLFPGLGELLLSAVLHSASPVRMSPQIPTCSCWYSYLCPDLVPSDFF